ncbi:hypothetical protein [Streptomyces sp. NPDC015131]|uniref:hypothetical protein n=1 Tax=Streptomyces sp. NPDC015131 TaxID=3364941 RepID=UPI003702C577
MTTTKRPARKANVLVAVTVLAAVTGLAGCGSDGKGAEGEPFAGQSADQIAEKAVKATRDARSVRMSGTAQQQGASVKVDFKVDEKDGCVGTMTGKGGKAEVRQTGQTMYLKGDQDFWKSALQGRPGTDKAVGQLQGKWVKSKPGEARTEGLCDKQAALAAMDGDKSERTGMKKGGTTTVDGRKALALHKQQPGGEKVTMYVAAEGDPYILRATSEGGKAPSEMVFSDYNKEVEVEAPPAGQVVDPATVAVGG